MFRRFIFLIISIYSLVLTYIYIYFLPENNPFRFVKYTKLDYLLFCVISILFVLLFVQIVFKKDSSYVRSGNLKLPWCLGFLFNFLRLDEEVAYKKNFDFYCKNRSFFLLLDFLFFFSFIVCVLFFNFSWILFYYDIQFAPLSFKKWRLIVVRLSLSLACMVIFILFTLFVFTTVSDSFIKNKKYIQYVSTVACALLLVHSFFKDLTSRWIYVAREHIPGFRFSRNFSIPISPKSYKFNWDSVAYAYNETDITYQLDLITLFVIQLGLVMCIFLFYKIVESFFLFFSDDDAYYPLVEFSFPNMYEIILKIRVFLFFLFSFSFLIVSAFMLFFLLFFDFLPLKVITFLFILLSFYNWYIWIPYEADLSNNELVSLGRTNFYNDYNSANKPRVHSEYDFEDFRVLTDEVYTTRMLRSDVFDIHHNIVYEIDPRCDEDWDDDDFEIDEEVDIDELSEVGAVAHRFVCLLESEPAKEHNEDDEEPEDVDILADFYSYGEWVWYFIPNNPSSQQVKLMQKFSIELELYVENKHVKKLSTLTLTLTEKKFKICNIKKKRKKIQVSLLKKRIKVVIDSKNKILAFEESFCKISTKIENKEEKKKQLVLKDTYYHEVADIDDDLLDEADVLQDDKNRNYIFDNLFFIEHTTDDFIDEEYTDYVVHSITLDNEEYRKNTYRKIIKKKNKIYFSSRLKGLQKVGKRDIFEDFFGDIFMYFVAIFSAALFVYLLIVLDSLLPEFPEE